MRMSRSARFSDVREEHQNRNCIRHACDCANYWQVDDPPLDNWTMRERRLLLRSISSCSRSLDTRTSAAGIKHNPFEYYRASPTTHNSLPDCSENFCKEINLAARISFRMAALVFVLLVFASQLLAQTSKGFQIGR